MTFDIAFATNTSSIKQRPAARGQVRHDRKRCHNTLITVVIDLNLASRTPVCSTPRALRDEGVDSVLFDRVHIEPTDKHFRHAMAFATGGRLHGCAAVRGASG